MNDMLVTRANVPQWQGLIESVRIPKHASHVGGVCRVPGPVGRR
jgi:hypothetical protein